MDAGAVPGKDRVGGRPSHGCRFPDEYDSDLNRFSQLRGEGRITNAQARKILETDSQAFYRL